MAAAKDKIKEEAGKIAGAIKEIITLVLPDAKPGTAKSAVVATAKQATKDDAITLFATSTATHAKATEAAGNKAVTIVAKATGEGMLKAIADDTTATKAVALAGGYAANGADGASANNDADITAIVGGTSVTELSDDVFAGAVTLQAITAEIGTADDAIAPSAAGDGPDANAAKDKIKKEAKAVAEAIKAIIDLVLPNAAKGNSR
ncbi:hypothetical protein DB313_05945 (plasmid) [Borrelia turcica IST7]|uniref:Variable large protein n=1 Tax=Borrelia turcica IST7 TaxID=1104446 RepID=A0A386PQA9_9SPIR|nr:hypothetical protein [Borrelia turcica]AYE37039.1 hypothetical protein DB313_05945 [Borrelia turcica IST7]